MRSIFAFHDKKVHFTTWRLMVDKYNIYTTTIRRGEEDDFDNL